MQREQVDADDGRPFGVAVKSFLQFLGASQTTHSSAPSHRPSRAMACPTPAASSFPLIHSEIEMHNLPLIHSEIEMQNLFFSPATRVDTSSASSTAATRVDTSSASSTAADPYSSSGDNGYDVFINHRGPDTKKTFASHVYRRFFLHGFRTFLDRKELQEGLNFPSQIVGAIRTASVHVAIFSPKYAESQWCLNELLLMRESRAPIIPIFYHVKPSNLRHGEALHKLRMKTTYDPQTGTTRPRYDSATLQNWRDALSSIADTSGFDLDGAFNGDEGQMLDEVVQRVVKMLAKKTRLYVANYPTGLDGKVKDFETTVLRQQHTEKVQVVGIVGSGGVGKTTLALEFFNRKCSEYDKSYFLSDVRENAKSSSHLLQLQRELLKGLTRWDRHVDNIHQGTQMLKEFLSSFQVLLVLDDIDHEDQVDKLLPERDFYCSNSLILITSRDGNVLKRSRLDESSIYKLTGLSAQHSQELFCSYAFCQPYPLEGFEDLVDKFLMACDGLPLSLKVFGGLLFGKNDKSSWEDTLNQVHEVPNDILERLRISYDALHEEEQQIFLDIACFFIGEKRDMTIKVWDGSGWKGLLRFQNLQSKCLVDVDINNCVRMHDHLRDMGRKIALDISPLRLWHPTCNIDDLLHQFSVITEVRGIRIFPNTDTDSDELLDSDDETLPLFQGRSQWKCGNCVLFGNCVMKLRNALHNTCFRFLGIGVKKLQLLDTEGHLLERILRRVHSPNLIWLSWRDCPYSYLPSWIPMKNLRVLKVEGRVFQSLWQGGSQAPIQLRELEISGPLSNISESIAQLKHLERIELYGCENLNTLPDSFGNLRSLQHIELFGCGSLERLPDSFGNLGNLRHIKLSGCRGLKRLPDSFGNLRNLQQIKLSDCWSLKMLPDSFGNLTNLQRIKMFGCRGWKRLPDSFANLRNVQHIHLSECQSLERLPDLFGNLMNLQYFELSRCESLQMLPNSFGNLRNLQHINLYRCQNLQRLPDSFGNLINLQHIKLFGCDNLERLPASFGNLMNLQHIKLSCCRSLDRLPDSFGNLTNAQHIDLSQCWRLDRLPDSFGNLRNVKHINLSQCWRLETLPESFGNLTNLQHIKLSECKSLQTLPNSLSNLGNLQHIDLHLCENLQRLPDSFGGLMNLQHINMIDCKNLQGLPSIKSLISLEQLNASFCMKLKSIPDLEQLTKLKLLDVSGCIALEELDGVEHCISLANLDAFPCPNLKLGEGVVNKLRQQNTIVRII